MTQEEFLSKILKERELFLNKGIDENRNLLVKNIEHKRSFLTAIMTISAASVAGLFIFLSSSINFCFCFKKLIELSAISFLVFIIFSTFYLAVILSRESLTIAGRLKFNLFSKEKFIEDANSEKIRTLKEYNEYVNKMHIQEKNKLEELEKKYKIVFGAEMWFWIDIFLFTLPWILLLIAFILFQK